MNIKQLLPNIMTLVLAVLLVLTQQAWAEPLAGRYSPLASAAIAQN